MLFSREKNRPRDKLMPQIELCTAMVNDQGDDPARISVYNDDAYIIMRPPCKEDSTQWNDIRGRNRDFLQPLEPTWPANCLSDDFFARRLSRQSHEWWNDQAYALLIFLDDGKNTHRQRQLIGGMNINHVSRGAAQFASLGYWIDQSHQGKGYMTKAMALTQIFCFERLKLHRINAAILPENDRSRNLLIRSGFMEEGFAKNYVKINGQWRDHILFGLPVEHWQNPARFSALL